MEVFFCPLYQDWHTPWRRQSHPWSSHRSLQLSQRESGLMDCAAVLRTWKFVSAAFTDLPFPTCLVLYAYLYHLLYQWLLGELFHSRAWIKTCHLNEQHCKKRSFHVAGLCGACLTCILTAYIAESLDEHWFLALLFPTCVPLALLTKLRAVLRIDVSREFVPLGLNSPPLRPCLTLYSHTFRHGTKSHLKLLRLKLCKSLWWCNKSHCIYSRATCALTCFWPSAACRAFSAEWRVNWRCTALSLFDRKTPINRCKFMQVPFDSFIVMTFSERLEETGAATVRILGKFLGLNLNLGSDLNLIGFKIDQLQHWKGELTGMDWRQNHRRCITVGAKDQDGTPHQKNLDQMTQWTVNIHCCSVKGSLSKTSDWRMHCNRCQVQTLNSSSSINF